MLILHMLKFRCWDVLNVCIIRKVQKNFVCGCDTIVFCFFCFFELWHMFCYNLYFIEVFKIITKI